MTQPYPLQHQVQQGKARPPLTEGFFRIARVTQGLLVLTALMHVALLAVDWYFLRFAERMIDTPRRVPMEDLERFDTVSMLTGFTQIGLVLLTGSAFISWLYKAHRSDRMNESALEHKSFWAIIGWFVPIMSLFRPNQMINDTRRGADPLAVTPVFQPFWWGACLLGVVGDRVVAGMWPTGDEPGLRTFGEKVKEAAMWEIGFGVVNLVGAVLAILVVREITAALRESPLGLRID
ncbi:MAG: DUF4328 domain-containing protein [Nocardioides sp.]|uniref:DUF4328 domain-containing protein n=1 Tax=Nocardioides sp. TaxID=35761 RepID=UPI003264F243